VTGTGKAAEIRAMREAGRTLVDIRDSLHARGFALCKQTVLNILNRQQAEAAA
jgi:hypothetical protein